MSDSFTTFRISSDQWASFSDSTDRFWAPVLDHMGYRIAIENVNIPTIMGTVTDHVVHIIPKSFNIPDKKNIEDAEFTVHEVNPVILLTDESESI